MRNNGSKYFIEFKVKAEFQMPVVKMTENTFSYSNIKIGCIMHYKRSLIDSHIHVYCTNLILQANYFHVYEELTKIKHIADGHIDNCITCKGHFLSPQKYKIYCYENMHWKQNHKV